jgi:hypothetical protein
MYDVSFIIDGRNHYHNVESRKQLQVAFIGLAAATIMITVGIIGAIQLQQASAARPQFCYTDLSVIGRHCYSTMSECREHQSTAINPSCCQAQVQR